MVWPCVLMSCKVGFGIENSVKSYICFYMQKYFFHDRSRRLLLDWIKNFLTAQIMIKNYFAFCRINLYGLIFIKKTQ